MKKLIILSTVLFASIAVKAQTPSGTTSKAAIARDAACNSYNAEKNAEKNMSPAVKSLYKAAQDPKETRARDAAYPILCNPPKKVVPKGTTRMAN